MSETKFDIKVKLNEIVKEEIEEKTINYAKWSKNKKKIKRTRVKIEIRNKLEGNHKFSIRWLNFKEK